MNHRFIRLLALALPLVFLLHGCEGAFSGNRRYTGKFTFVYRKQYWTQSTGVNYVNENLGGTVEIGEEKDEMVLNVTYVPDNVFLVFTMGDGDSLWIGDDPAQYIGRYVGKDEVVFDGQAVHAPSEYNNRLLSAARK